MSDLLYEIRDRIGYATLNRPDVRNALTFEMYEGLAKLCRETELGGDVDCIVIAGAGGKAFAAGTDMTQFRAFSQPQDALDYETRIDSALTDLEKCPVPTIAAVTGACTGGGGAIAAACDIRLCDERLKFGFPIARTLGNCLSISNLARLSALIGAGRVRDLVLTSRLLEAEEARQCGLVSKVLSDADSVLARAGELAAQMQGHAPLTMKATKEALRRLRIDGPDAEASDLIVECYMSEDFKEGLEAFLGKRKPEWKGR